MALVPDIINTLGSKCRFITNVACKYIYICINISTVMCVCILYICLLILCNNCFCTEKKLASLNSRAPNLNYSIICYYDYFNCPRIFYYFRCVYGNWIK